MHQPESRRQRSSVAFLHSSPRGESLVFTHVVVVVVVVVCVYTGSKVVPADGPMFSASWLEKQSLTDQGS